MVNDVFQRIVLYALFHLCYQALTRPTKLVYETLIGFIGSQ
nr:MAG TPA: hypothetical protein [Caudoviricetes sp.]